MSWVATGISALVSIAVGLLLWAFLPRGVVLTRQVWTKDSGGNPLYDTWRITNDSSLPVRITSIRYVTPDTWNDESRSFDEPVLPSDGTDGIRLSLDDSTAEVARMDWKRPWSEVVVEPGDTLTAVVGTNTTLLIDYRRAGRVGLFERRHLTIHGGV